MNLLTLGNIKTAKQQKLWIVYFFKTVFNTLLVLKKKTIANPYTGFTVYSQ